jgi:hypothetical protein
MEDPRILTPGHDGDDHDNMNMSMRTKKTEFLAFSKTNFGDANQKLKDHLYISKNSFQGAPMPKSCLKESFMFGPGNFSTPDNANAPTGEKEGFLRSMPVLFGHNNPQDQDLSFMENKNEQEQQEKSNRMTMGACGANSNGLKWENNSLNRKSIELSKNLQNNLYYIHPNNAMYNYHPPSRGLSNTESKLLLNPISNQNSVLPGMNFQPQKNESLNYNPYGINRENHKEKMYFNSNNRMRSVSEGLRKSLNRIPPKVNKEIVDLVKNENSLIKKENSKNKIIINVLTGKVSLRLIFH